jgi:tripeptidyl-peptidase-2
MLRLRRARPAALIGCVLALLLTAPSVARDWASYRSRGSDAKQQAKVSFPVDGLLPKKETGALRLRREHPRADGRGVVVAIFDTGLDPGAPGLQVTSDGKPKIVDLVDASGGGDVDTSTVRRAAQGRVESLTGRSLALGRGPRWRCPTGEYHVGAKPAWELFPGGLVARLKARRHERFDEIHRGTEAKLLRRLAEWEREHDSPDDRARAERKDLELRLERLRKAAEDRTDLGPVLDCVVFHDGTHWRAVVDTDEDGELGDEAVLASYRHEREHATFGDEDLLNFSINVYEDGDLLSIVTEGGAHGTHVAGIVAGHFPDQRELDGIAPGAQLVGVKIGDVRVGTSSLGTGEIRGLAAVLRSDCKVINMSYGGASPQADRGRTAALYSEIVNEHGVVFVSSAGNSGPALSTVGAPGGTTSAILGVGATVTPSMMRDEYSLRELLPENQYTWSSRGPALDGHLGVDVTAPGGAISPVPNWVLQRNMLMNGTSMSSPSVAGGVAALVSGLEQRGLPWSPASIHRALKATARPVQGQDPWSQGAGLVQLDDAFDHLVAHARRGDVPVRYSVTVSGASGRRGVYLREPIESGRVHDVGVTVRSAFPEDWDNRDRVDFQQRVVLESTAPWVQSPSHVLLMHGGRGFDVRVDPTGLPPGAHHAEVVARDSADPSAGALFRVPVTVIRPLQPRSAGRSPAGDEAALQETLRFTPGDIERRFLAVPHGATWADVSLRTSAADERRTIVLHAVQLLPDRAFPARGRRWYVGLEPGEQAVRSLAVEGGRTLEVTLAQFWSSLGASEVELDVSFHGIEPEPSALFLGPGAAGVRVDATATFRRETLEPKAVARMLRRSLRPEKAVIEPRIGDRDLLPKGRREHQLVLTYRFEVDGKRKVTPSLARTNVPGWDDLFESGLWMIHDASNRRVAVGVIGHGQAELAKGEQVLRVHLRHDSAEQLRKLESSVAWLDFALEDELQLPVRSEATGLITGSGSFGRRALDAGQRVSAWVGPPSAKDLPEHARAGDLLVGNLRLGTEAGPLEGAGHRPGGWPLLVAVPEKSKEKKEGGDAGEEDEPPLTELELESALELAARLRDDDRHDDATAVLDRVRGDHETDLRLLREALHQAQARADEEDGERAREPVLAAAEALLAAIDLEGLAAWRGRKRPTDEEASPAEQRERKRRDRELESLRHALLARATALETRGEDESFERAFTELTSWADESQEGYRELLVARESRRGRHGRALEVVDGLIADAPAERDRRERRIELLRELGWDHLADEEERWLAVRFPGALPRF